MWDCEIDSLMMGLAMGLGKGISFWDGALSFSFLSFHLFSSRVDTDLIFSEAAAEQRGTYLYRRYLHSHPAFQVTLISVLQDSLQLLVDVEDLYW